MQSSKKIVVFQRTAQDDVIKQRASQSLRTWKPLELLFTWKQNLFITFFLLLLLQYANYFHLHRQAVSYVHKFN